MELRRGILGGSFDPIHLGHVAAALGVIEVRGLERVYFIPAGRPPHKPQGCEAPFSDRVAMARRAVRDHDALEVLDLEGSRPGPSYSVDTAEELARRHPGVGWDLLVGADMLEDLPNWHRARDLVDLVQVVAFARPDFDLEGPRGVFRAEFGKDPVCVTLRLVEAASTRVRRRIAAGEPIDAFLDPAVSAYIADRNLYRGPGNDEGRG